MLVLDGKSVFGGIAIGKIALFEKGDADCRQSPRQMSWIFLVLKH